MNRVVLLIEMKQDVIVDQPLVLMDAEEQDVAANLVRLLLHLLRVDLVQEDLAQVVRVVEIPVQENYMQTFREAHLDAVTEEALAVNIGLLLKQQALKFVTAEARPKQPEPTFPDIRAALVSNPTQSVLPQ